MHDTLQSLREHLSRLGRPAKVVVWAHNSHLGDARATDMAGRGELNLGQLVRQNDPSDSVAIGLTTSVGTVSAASDWDGPLHRKHVRTPFPGSCERVFHDSGVSRFFLPVAPRFASDGVVGALGGRRPQRFIGVIYRPETERLSHYFDADLPAQFDAVLHFDETRALRPLRSTPTWESLDAPETYPAGL
jgi:erythromycin esterase-like protein